MNQTQKTKALQQVSVFFALTIGLSYLVFWGPLALFQVPTISFVKAGNGPAWAIALFMTGGFVPSLVAVFLTGIWEGRPGLRRLGRRIIQFNIGWRWYLAALAIVILGTVGQLTIIRLLGQTFDMGLFLAQLGSFLPLIIIGPLSEELGWRGYAQERLQAKWHPLVAGAVVGVVWGLWHLPLFFMVGTSQHELAIPFVGFLCGVTAISICFAWLTNNTNGSIWTAIFFHWIYTYSGQVTASGVTRSPLYNWLEYTPYMVMAIFVIFIWKAAAVRNKNTQKLTTSN